VINGQTSNMDILAGSVRTVVFRSSIGFGSLGCGVGAARSTLDARLTVPIRKQLCDKPLPMFGVAFV
jgi:hypothetical protein